MHDMHDMHGMAWVHWTGVALAAPAAIAVFHASWRSFREQHTLGRLARPILDKENR